MSTTYFTSLLHLTLSTSAVEARPSLAEYVSHWSSWEQPRVLVLGSTQQYVIGFDPLVWPLHTFGMIFDSSAKVCKELYNQAEPLHVSVGSVVMAYDVRITEPAENLYELRCRVDKDLYSQVYGSIDTNRHFDAFALMVEAYEGRILGPSAGWEVSCPEDRRPVHAVGQVECIEGISPVSHEIQPSIEENDLSTSSVLSMTLDNTASASL